MMNARSWTMLAALVVLSGCAADATEERTTTARQAQGGEDALTGGSADGLAKTSGSEDTGKPSANPDTGTPSANPDTGTPSASPDTGAKGAPEEGKSGGSEAGSKGGG